ncbi:MAG TPA: DUF4954 family protein [Gemmataceae bacterium]|nr:DUF4954 family protein [Gemmataceae bacterium]
MRDEVLTRLRTALAESELLRTVSSIRRDNGKNLVLGDLLLRPLYRDEITRLEGDGNSSPDWSRVKVADGFDWRRLRNSSFHGDVLLGRCLRQVRVAEGFDLPAGIYGSTVCDCVIGGDVLIRDVKLLANYVVADGATLLDCGAITCDPRTTFGNGIELSLGIETGGREVALYAEIDVESAAEVAGMRVRKGFLDAYTRAVADYTARATSCRGYIGHSACVRSTPRVRNVYVGSFAVIDGATLVTDSTLLSDAAEPTRIESGACVRGSILQWGSSVTSLAIVERSVLTEQSHVEEHGKVKNSLLGANTHIAAGEVTASLMGPFVNMHHQSLLIATYWPEGRGNVSYGANVGANHTSKAPDQECWPGEGAFLGLGINVKFPVDLSQAPYTVVAAGVTLLPQKVLYPFSLINTPALAHAGISPALNQIIPAWLLTDNLFAVQRTEGKFRARNRASRSQFDLRVFRPAIVDLMRAACRRLQTVSTPREVYTERDLEGLGKNFMLEAHRTSAIESYRLFIKYYALLSLKEQVTASLDQLPRESLNDLLRAPHSNRDWEHARQVLVNELGIQDVVAALRQLPEILQRIARDVEQSKAKDDERGARIIEGYEHAHVAAAEDPFVLQAREDMCRLEREVQELVERLLGMNQRLKGPHQQRARV